MIEADDDTIISVWFRRSLLALGGVVLLAGVGWWFTRDSSEEEVVEESEPEAPLVSTQDTPAVPLPNFYFVERAAAAGLDFRFENGAFGERYLPETMVGGVAVLDFDLDGDSDVLLTGGNRWPFEEGTERLAQTVGLFRNDGQGSFQRVDVEVGLTTDAYVMGMAVGDPDGDGDPDVYLTTVGANLLFENLGGAGFREVPDAAGAGIEEAWSTGASFTDVNADGWPDLVVVNYVQWSPQLDREANYEIAGLGRAYGPPTNFPGSLPRLYVNQGDGSFVDQSAAAGLHEVPEGSAKSLAVLPRDFDRDGDVDLFVANDTTRNFLYVNDGSGRFVEEGQSSGVAFDNTGKSTGAMGVDATWSLASGNLALAVGNFANEMTSFYVSEGEGAQFADNAIISGIGPASRQALTFGLFFADLDGDGREDLLQVNGHVENLINRVQPSQQFEQPVQLFWNCGQACSRPFVPVPAVGSGDLTNALAGRGAAAADIDGDGDLDLLLAEVGGRPRLLVNETPQADRHFRLRLVGAHPNTEALGAIVEVESGDRLQRREISRTRSYLSQFDLSQLFAMGPSPVRVRVRWPDGIMSVREDVQAGETMVLVHPAAP